MRKFLALRCPAVRDKAKTSNGKIHYCSALLKIYRDSAEFEEFINCPACGTHWRFVKMKNGVLTAMVVPKEMKIKSFQIPIVVIGCKDEK